MPVANDTPAADTAPRVLIDALDQVLVIRMNRRHKANAIDAAMTVALDGALNAFEDDPALRVAVLTGGPGVFSAGSDLETGSGAPTARGGEYGVIRRESSKPLIAAVEGPAFGGGFEIVMACDLVVAGEAARFAFPEVARGLVASSGALFRAPMALPPVIANELLLTGREMSATEALERGVINRLTKPSGAVDGAVKLAQAIAVNAPTAVNETVRATRASCRAGDARGWRLTESAVTNTLASNERDEGIRAFKHGREPNWPARS